ncbi:MAG: Ig-like domain-containing protein [Ferruginibacter sp.]
MRNYIFTLLVLGLAGYCIIIFWSGCAQISAPTGGPRDTIAPVLIRANPPNQSVNFRGNKVELTFDEYIDVHDVQQNVLVSPLQKNNPVINFNFRNVTIKLRDTLLPNTTYSIHFGDALKDLNEGNPFKDFVYTFSTGNTIDSLIFSGNIIMAETGKVDTTLIALLYRNATDSAVRKIRPSYIAKIKSDGKFNFSNLPPGEFRIYALRDGDGSKTYNSPTEAFAFNDTPVVITGNNDPITLSAYEEIKDDVSKKAPIRSTLEKRLRFTTNAGTFPQDLLSPFEIVFNNPVKDFRQPGLILADTNFQQIKNVEYLLDSTRKKLNIKVSWQPGFHYNLIIDKNAFEDSAGNVLVRTDTLFFITRENKDYGSLLLRFKNIDLSKHPVIQFVDSDKIKFSMPLVSTEWSDKMFPPGEYEIRILYDANKNGKWDPGNFSKKLQPEKAITIPQKLTIRANWDNERDIVL